MKSHKEVLEAALEWFENGKKWEKGGLWFASEEWDSETNEMNYIENSKACLVGAMILVQYEEASDYYENSTMLPCTTTLSTVICDLFPDRVRVESDNIIQNIENFNDHDDTTYEDITLVLKHAIDREDAEYLKLWEGNHLA